MDKIKFQDPYENLKLCPINGFTVCTEKCAWHCNDQRGCAIRKMAEKNKDEAQENI